LESLCRKWRWIETQQVHADRNKVGSAYNHQTEALMALEFFNRMSQGAIEAHGRVDNERRMFPAKAMIALQAIMSLNKRH
jgi:hypothetical protein